MPCLIERLAVTPSSLPYKVIICIELNLQRNTFFLTVNDRPTSRQVDLRAAPSFDRLPSPPPSPLARGQMLCLKFNTSMCARVIYGLTVPHGRCPALKFRNLSKSSTVSCKLLIPLSLPWPYALGVAFDPTPQSQLRHVRPPLHRVVPPCGRGWICQILTEHRALARGAPIWPKSEFLA